LERGGTWGAYRRSRGRNGLLDLQTELIDPFLDVIASMPNHLNILEWKQDALKTFGNMPRLRVVVILNVIPMRKRNDI
jgi:hypothetical protein